MTLHYSKSLKAIRSRTEYIYDSARRKLTKSFRSRKKQSQQESCIALEDYEAHEPGQLTVNKGQRLQIIEFYVDAPEWALVSLTTESGEQRQGVVPFSILSNEISVVGKNSFRRRIAANTTPLETL
ncbi:unnamed protein product [Dracunculus medinensis]|uniref:SH3 domain-containing protein n=1 Tax=Dracunculus medinensis TaxID=318479 RepID=A0A158Q4A1_DRAME|nr:unnamed protein product [Dracunculus medinensis]